MFFIVVYSICLEDMFYGSYVTSKTWFLDFVSYDIVPNVDGRKRSLVISFFPLGSDCLFWVLQVIVNNYSQLIPFVKVNLSVWDTMVDFLSYLKIANF